MMRQTHVPPNITKSTKLRCAKSSPELAFKRMDFRVPENLIFPALKNGQILLYCHFNKIIIKKRLFFNKNMLDVTYFEIRGFHKNTKI